MYICTKAFKAKSGDSYRLNQIISRYHFIMMPESDRDHFVWSDEDDKSKNDISDVLMPAGMGGISETMMVSPNDFDAPIDNTPQPNTDFQGFDGGDSGGGGASGDW